MKVGLIIPGNLWLTPYIRIYTQVLREKDVDYDIISWNRDGTDVKEGYQYNRQFKIHGRLSKLFPYICYSLFIIKTLRKNNYDKLIVSGPQIAIFIARYLCRYYKKKYIFDYRDVSIEQKLILRKRFSLVLNNSVANFISSPGFEKCLPHGFEYYISHNFNIKEVKATLECPIDYSHNTENIEVLTIGGIRNYSSNIKIVQNLANNKDVLLKFVGKGAASTRIESYCKINGIENIEFYGYYPKEEEKQYVMSASFLNIYYPKIITHDTVLSNRFYNALIYKKPMIVTKNTIQGDYVEKYQLGVAIDETCSDLYDRLVQWEQTTDYKKFAERCNVLLKEFVKDYDKFKQIIIDFIS